MKTLLFLTNFSPLAPQAADYAYKLAKQLKLKMLICNAVTPATHIPQAGFLNLPSEYWDALLNNSTEQLKQLKKQLEHSDHSDGFHPIVNCTNGLGSISDVVEQVSGRHQVAMVVMSANGISRINEIKLPLLLVPPTAAPVRIKKIAFASDFLDQEQDLENIYKLIPFARSLDAEILLVHVFKENDAANCAWDKEFLNKISNKANYPNIFYRNIIQNNTVKGLNWISDVGNVDVLAMVHKTNGFMSTLLGNSHTHKVTDKTAIPIFILQGAPN